MRIRMLVAVALALALGATAAQAQIGGGFPGGRGGFPGGRGGMGREGRGGPRYGGPEQPLTVPDTSNPVRLIVASKDSLKLTPDQLQKVDSVAKALDRQYDTLLAQVRRAFGTDSASRAARDSARRAGGGPDYPVRDDVALRDRLNVLKPTFKDIKQNQDNAWKAATAFLTKPQKKQADAIRKEDEKVQAQEQQRWQRRRGRGGEGGDGF